MLAGFREAGQRIDRLGQFVPRISVIHGPRGIGKTSLLREGQRILETNRTRTVWITADPGELLLQTLLNELGKALGSRTKLTRRAVRHIESVSVEIGNAAVGKVSTVVKADARPAAGSSSGRLIDAITSALDAIRAEGDSGIAILIDEIQEADDAGLRTLAYAWQELAACSGADIARAALFAVGLPGAPAHINRAVSFSERFQCESLDGLDDDGVRDALVGPADWLDVAWDDRALGVAVAESEGYPHKVQLVGDSAWRAGCVRVGGDGLAPGHSITVVDVQQALTRVGEEMNTLHRFRWNAASPRQREILVAMARLGGLAVKRSRLAEELDADTRAISIPRQALLDKGIVGADGHGQMSFTVPGFTEFVLARAKEE
jgi:hypothetical protein